MRLRYSLTEYMKWYDGQINSDNELIAFHAREKDKHLTESNDLPFASQRVEARMKVEEQKKLLADAEARLEATKNRECKVLYFYEFKEKRGFKMEGNKMISAYEPSKTFVHPVSMKACEVNTAPTPEYEGRLPSYIEVEVIF